MSRERRSSANCYGTDLTTNASVIPRFEAEFGGGVSVNPPVSEQHAVLISRRRSRYVPVENIVEHRCRFALQRIAVATTTRPVRDEPVASLHLVIRHLRHEIGLVSVLAAQLEVGDRTVAA